MYDKRIIRGSNYTALVPQQPDMAEVQKQREAQRRKLMRANQTKKRITTPEPVMGRKHMDIQTDSYLEELTERIVEFEAETQTDFLLDRPASPLFMPAKNGVDIQTQIEEGDLFDFDVECEPVLEVIVGKTLEQSMMEVLEEEELESLRRHQEDYQKRRNAELQEVQRMEAAEKRRSDEVERRRQQQAAQKEQDMSMMRKVVSRTMAAAHLSSLKERALAHLLDAGVFAHESQQSIDSVFVPQLLEMVTNQMQQLTREQQTIQDVMQSAMAQRLEHHEGVLAAERARIQEIEEAEREARKERDADRQRREDEKKRIEQEQEAMITWEKTEPPPPPKEEIEIVGIDQDQRMVVLSDERKLPFAGADELFASLTEMLAQEGEDKKLIMCTVSEGPDGPEVNEFFTPDPPQTQEPAEPET